MSERLFPRSFLAAKHIQLWCAHRIGSGQRQRQFFLHDPSNLTGGLIGGSVS
jgi:hypothetical protein